MKNKQLSTLKICRIIIGLTLILFLSGVFLLDPLPVAGSAVATATRTPTRRPTKTPTPRAATFSLPSGNKTNPGDLLQELFIGGKGGGAGGSSEYCNSSSISPYFSSDFNSQQELFTDMLLNTCGWKENETIDITLQYPNGKVVRKQATAYLSKGKTYAYTYLETEWADPEGIYRVTFRGPSGQVMADLNVSRPTAPRLVVFGPGNLLLYHFSPNEQVRLLAYGSCKSSIQPGDGECLLAWQGYQVDGQGNLSLKFAQDPNIYEMYILAEKSGEVNVPVSTGSFDLAKLSAEDSRIRRSSCPGAPPQRLKVYWYARVCTKGDRVKVRQQPSRSAAVIVLLDPGTDLSVVGGPSCSDNWSWWKVSWDKTGQTGWISEGGDATDPYFLCPSY